MWHASRGTGVDRPTLFWRLISLMDSTSPSPWKHAGKAYLIVKGVLRQYDSRMIGGEYTRRLIHRHRNDRQIKGAAML